MTEFSHYDKNASAVMVDISDKNETRRTACAYGCVKMRASTIELIEKRLLPKGDCFEIARIAGIMAAKRTAELIPLCHSLNLSFVDVKISIDKEKSMVDIDSEIRLDGRTGAEMEALTAVSVAALTVYDMCKAVDKSISIEKVFLKSKKGGKSDYSVI
jgi:cyclic pyranopterin phosphate synthase